MKKEQNLQTAETQVLNIPVVSVPLPVIMQVLKYCEDNQIYDKLGTYQNFYYKLTPFLEASFRVSMPLSTIYLR